MILVSLCLQLALLRNTFALRPSGAADAVAPVAYPEGYRNWPHVKSTLISPAHAQFANIGGFQHIYANSEGMVGYRSRAFPEGSIVVFDWLEMRDKDGAFEEGPRRQVDVMVKDSQRFAATGGWGFQRFVKDSKTELAATPTPQQCFACHEKLKQDGLILSRYRQ
jgi:Cytochrome P460